MSDTKKSVKRTFRVTKAGRFTDADGKVVVLAEGETIVLHEEDAATYPGCLRTLPPQGPKRPFVVKRGSFTQDVDGERKEFHEGDVILLTQEEADSYESDRLESAQAAPAAAAQPQVAASAETLGSERKP